MRRVYFAFNYADVRDFRVNVVRNCGIVGKQDTFLDASLWEKVKKTSDLAIKRMINKGLERTTATVVLIGSGTYDRRWVRYEIAKSIERGNALVGVKIHNIRDKNQTTAAKGKNPFDYMGISERHNVVTLYEKETFLDIFWVRSPHISPIPSAKFSYTAPPSNGCKLSIFVPTYDWVTDKGHANIHTWIDEAFQQQRMLTRKM